MKLDLGRNEGIYEITANLRKFIDTRFSHLYHVYSNYNKQGVAMIKNKNTQERTIFKPWATSYKINKKRLQKAEERYSNFQGQNVDNFIFIANNFRGNARRYAQISDSIGIIKINIQENELIIYGSNYLDKMLMSILVGFSEVIGFNITHDYPSENLDYRTISDLEECENKDETGEDEKSYPTAFISYAKEGKNHQEWVVSLACDLIRNGVQVIIDEWNLDDYGGDIDYFIERGIKKSDHVIMVCTPHYAKKANNRRGGVGRENTIITTDYYNKDKKGKFKPIVKERVDGIRKSLPNYMKSKYAIDFSNQKEYEDNLEELLRKIFSQPKYERPELGEKPKLESKLPSESQSQDGSDDDLSFERFADENLGQLDKEVITTVCDKAIRIQRPHIETSSIEKELERANKDDIYDSLKFLEEKGYIDLERTLGGHMPSFEITYKGFEKYCREYISDYEDVIKHVAYEIVKNKVKTGRKLSEETNSSQMLIDHVLEYFSKNGFIELKEDSTGYFISNVSETLKRKVKDDF